MFITTSFDDVFAKNFFPLVDKCKLDITCWSSLPLSLIGCINLIKMVILPKFLYLFQHIPVFIRWCHRFYGLIKPHALRKPFYNSPKVGGMALPNFIQYYWACNIDKLCFQIDSNANICPSWAQMELQFSMLSLQSLMTAQLPLKIHNISQNPVVTNSIKIWIQFRKHFGLDKPSVCPSF